jgi:methyl-accepting chemotaxis protein
MGSLATSVETMPKAADTMAQAARNVYDQAGSTAGGAEHSSHQLTAVAAAIEEMTSSVAEVSCHFP